MGWRTQPVPRRLGPKLPIDGLVAFGASGYAPSTGTWRPFGQPGSSATILTQTQTVRFSPHEILKTAPDSCVVLCTLQLRLGKRASKAGGFAGGSAHVRH